MTETILGDVAESQTQAGNGCLNVVGIPQDPLVAEPQANEQGVRALEGSNPSVAINSPSLEPESHSENGCMAASERTTPNDSVIAGGEALAASDYQSFLTSKRLIIPPAGIQPGEVNPLMRPDQRDVTKWCLRRGRAAVFADCGLGKTFDELEWAKQISKLGKVLILCPLAVADQTVREGQKFGIEVHYHRRGIYIDSPITITNYELLEHFDASQFVGVVLDESSILKHYDGKTRNQIINAFRRTPYRLACTATPAPNDYMELGNHAEFLGIMSRAEMLSMFFVHDGGDTSKWRIKGHAQKDFWKWVCSWAVMLRKPSDLGYSDEGFNLPPLNVQQIEVESEQSGDTLFQMEARTLQERIAARRDSISTRVQKAAELVNFRAVIEGSSNTVTNRERRTFRGDYPPCLHESDLSRPTNLEQWVCWCALNDEADALVKQIPGAVQIKGTDKPEVKISKLQKFISGETRVLVTKGSISAHGLNLQFCHNTVFVGISDSWEEYYQAVRRFWRFGQTQPVNVYIVTSTAEGAVVANIKRKEQDADRMATEMIANMHELNEQNLKGSERTEDTYSEKTVIGENWQMHLGDCVELAKTLPDDSIDFSVFSPPFASLYTYSASDRDMGNAKSYQEFFQHFGFLVKELYRVLKPGRNISFHCMNLPTTKSFHGYIGIQDFRGDLIRQFESAGFIYHSEVCIWKDPVTAMQRTKALGLLWKQVKKDSTMSRQGIADYVVTVRKPGENGNPVSHTPEGFPVQQWQEWASPVWMDINPSDTLQFRSAREHEDERHICPLQLEVIKRALILWSNRGDLVFSPFAGIGSEGFVAIQNGRRFFGCELKQSYFRQACSNLEAAVREQKDKSLELQLTSDAMAFAQGITQ